MDQAAADGRWTDHARLEKQWMNALLGKSGPRADNDQEDPKPAKQPSGSKEPAPEPNGIDWDLVNREAAIVVELNRKAMNLWKKEQEAQRSSSKSAEQFNS